MTFRAPFQIPRAVFHLRQARSPERLKKNFCQLDGLKNNVPTTNGEQITNIHNAYILDDCKKCFKLSVQEQLSHLSVDKKNKLFSPRSKFRKDCRNPKNTYFIEPEKNEDDLFCKFNENREKLHAPKSKTKHDTLKPNPYMYDLVKRKQRKTVKFKNEEQNQKICFQDEKQNKEEYFPLKLGTSNINPNLNKPSKISNDEQILYTHEPRATSRTERRDHIKCYKVKPKKSNIFSNEYTPEIVTITQENKPLRKVYDDPKSTYKHQYYNSTLPDDISGYRVTQNKLSKLQIPNENILGAQNEIGSYSPTKRSPQQYYDNTRHSEDHCNGEKAGEIFRCGVLPNTSNLTPRDYERCNKLSLIRQGEPRVTQKKSYDDAELPYFEVSKKCDFTKRCYDKTGYTAKELPQIENLNEDIHCYRKNIQILEKPNPKLEIKPQDTHKLPLGKYQASWCKETPRSDDMGYEIERKKLSNLPLNISWTKEIVDNTLPRLNKIKQSFDDKLIPYTQNANHQQSFKNSSKFDDIFDYTISSKKNPSKTKLLRPKNMIHKKCSNEPLKQLFNMYPSKLNEGLCCRKKKPKLPSFRTTHTCYSTYTSGLPPIRASILHTTSRKYPSLNTSHKYSSYTKEYMIEKPFIQSLFKMDDPAVGPQMDNVTLETQMEDLSPYIVEYQNGITEDLKNIKPPLTTWGYVDPVKNKSDKKIDISNIEYCTPAVTMQAELQENTVDEIINPLAGWGFLGTPKDGETQNFITAETDLDINQLRRTYSTRAECCPHAYSIPCQKVDAPYLSYSDYKSISFSKDPIECPSLFCRLLQPSYQFNDPIYKVKPPPPVWGHVDPSIEEKCRINYKSNGLLYDGPWAEREEFNNICAKYYEKHCPPRAPESCCYDRPKIECINKTIAPYLSFSDRKPQFPDVEQNECWHARMMARKQKVTLNLEKAKKHIKKWFSTTNCSSFKKPVKVCTSSCYLSKTTNKKNNNFNKGGLVCKGPYRYVEGEKRDSSPPTYNSNFLSGRCFRKFSFKNIHTTMPDYRPEKSKMKCKSDEYECYEKKDQVVCREKCTESKSNKNCAKNCNDAIQEIRNSPNYIASVATVKRVLSKYDKNVQKKCKEIAKKKNAIKECCSEAKALSSKKSSYKYDSKPCCPEQKTRKHSGHDKKKTAKGKSSSKGKPPIKLSQKKSGKDKSDKKKKTIKGGLCYTCSPKPRPTLLEKLQAYFRARPNCPGPDEWKKQQLRDKAIKAAREAGLEICEKSKKYCGRVKKLDKLPEKEKKKYSTYSITNIEKHHSKRKYSTYPYIHARKMDMINNEDNSLFKTYSKKSLPCNRNFSMIVNCPSRENILLPRHSEISLISYRNNYQQKSLKYTKPIRCRNLATYVSNQPSTTVQIPSKNISMNTLTNTNSFVGRMYQVKLSKIGVKNGLLRRNVEDEPYTFCQICKFVPRTSPLLNNAEKRKCN